MREDGDGLGLHVFGNRELPAFDEGAGLGGVDTGTYYFKRRSDLLYYRVLSATLTKPDGDTESLLDYDADNPYQVLDLNDVEVPYGGVYYLSGDLYAAWEF